MAKDASDREDLLREATGLSPRMELELPDMDEPIFCGFRANGAFSLYWGQDLVIQFNAQQELRRAFWCDGMVASYKRKLHWLKPDGSSNSTETGRVRLKRIAFSPSESQTLLSIAHDRLRELEEVLRSDEPIVIKKVPAMADVETDVIAWLQDLETIEFALHPGVGK